MNHTPGPWKASECQRGKLGAAPNGPEATICEISLEPKTAVDCNGGFSHVTDPEANACLIAAAPDLLEACQWFVSQLGDRVLIRNTEADHDPNWTMRMLDFTQNLHKAVTAIAKATVPTGK